MKKILTLTAGLLCSLMSIAQLNTERILTIGQNALYFEDYVLSIQYFNQVIKIKPYLAEPWLYRGIAKIELGDYQGADQDLTEAVERNPFMSQAYYARGFARRSLKLYKEATEDFTKALQFNPDGQNLLLNRMDSRERTEDYQGAMQDLEHYIKLNPKNNAVLYEKGRLLMAMKDTVAAVKAFDEFVLKDSTNSLAWSARALLRMQKEDKKGALSDYDRAIKLKSNYFGDFINRGILNVQTKNYNQALSDYNNAIKLDKTSALAYYNRGLLRANLGDKNNALSDLNMVVKLDSSNTEALLSKAGLELDLGDFRGAIRDYKIILKRYEYFIPAYMGIAQAEQALGNIKIAYQYRVQADNIEKNKDNINRKIKQSLKADNKMLTTTQKSRTAVKTEFFNRFAGQEDDNAATDSKYTDNDTRGAVQNKYTDVVNERSFILSYYVKADELRRTNTFLPVLEKYNRTRKLSGALRITNNELPLPADLITGHFEAINRISASLSQNDTDPDLYFGRALEFALVQDFNSAVDDLNKAIALRPDFTLAYFYRAGIRNKLVEYRRNNEVADNTITGKNQHAANEKQNVFDAELIMRDYDKVCELVPDFSFAYYNKANILCTQKNFRTAIANYSKAIEIDHDFAEAYYNRGLTYLFTGEDKKGLADLSKAGELGIYAAYNLITRFKKDTATNE